MEPADENSCGTKQHSQTADVLSVNKWKTKSDVMESASSGFSSHFDSMYLQSSRDKISRHALKCIKSDVSRTHDDDVITPDRESNRFQMTKNHDYTSQRRADIVENTVQQMAVVIKKLQKIDTMLHETRNGCFSLMNLLSALSNDKKSTSQKSHNTGLEYSICSSWADNFSTEPDSDLISDDPTGEDVDDQRQTHAGYSNVDVFDTLSQPIECRKSLSGSMPATSLEVQEDRRCCHPTLLPDQPITHKDKNEVEETHMALNQKSFGTDILLDFCSTTFPSISVMISETEGTYKEKNKSDLMESASSGFSSRCDSMLLQSAGDKISRHALKCIKSDVSRTHDDDVIAPDRESNRFQMTENHDYTSQQRADIVENTVQQMAVVINNLQKIDTMLHETRNGCFSLMNLLSALSNDKKSTSQKSHNTGLEYSICSSWADNFRTEPDSDLISDDPTGEDVDDQRQTHAGYSNVDVFDTLSQPIECRKSLSGRMPATSLEVQEDRRYYLPTLLPDQPITHKDKNEVEETHMALNQESYGTDMLLEFSSTSFPSILGMFSETEGTFACKAISHNPKLCNDYVFNEQDVHNEMVHGDQSNALQEHFEVNVTNMTLNQEIFLEATSLHDVSTSIPTGSSLIVETAIKENLISGNCENKESDTNKQKVQTEAVQSNEQNTAHENFNAAHMSLNQETFLEETSLKYVSINNVTGSNLVVEAAAETVRQDVKTANWHQENVSNRLDVKTKVFLDDYVEQASYDDRQYPTNYDCIRAANILPLTDDQDYRTNEQNLDYLSSERTMFDTGYEQWMTTENSVQCYMISQVHHSRLQQNLVRMESSEQPDLSNTTSGSDLASGTTPDHFVLDVGSATDDWHDESLVRGTCVPGPEVQHNRENSPAVSRVQQNMPQFVDDYRQMENMAVPGDRGNIPIVQAEEDDRIEDINLLQLIDMRNPAFPLQTDIQIHNDTDDGHHNFTTDVDMRERRRQLALERPFMMCATCFQRPRETVNIPCRCMCNCLECERDMVVCTMCQSRIEASFQCRL